MTLLTSFTLVGVALTAFGSRAAAFSQSGGVNCTVPCTAQAVTTVTGQIPASVHFFVSPGTSSSTVGKAVCQPCETEPPCKYDGWEMEWTGNSVHKLEITRPGGQVIAPDQLSRPGALATDCGASPDFVVFKIYYTAVSPWTLMYTHSITLSCGC